MTNHTQLPNLDTAAIGSPITRLGVSFFPVYLMEGDLPEISTGRDSGLVIDELDNPSVPTLLAYNPTDKPILVVEGQHFLGGQAESHDQRNGPRSGQDQTGNPGFLPGAGPLGSSRSVPASRDVHSPQGAPPEGGGGQLLHGTRVVLAKVTRAPSGAKSKTCWATRELPQRRRRQPISTTCTAGRTDGPRQRRTLSGGGRFHARAGSQSLTGARW